MSWHFQNHEQTELTGSVVYTLGSLEAERWQSLSLEAI